MTLSGPTARFTEEMVSELIAALKKTCLEISLKLGAERSAVSLLEGGAS
jgi:DNA-binding IclR family transcriptional regulator